MKRHSLYTLLVVVFCLGLFVACQNEGDEAQPAPETTTEDTAVATVPAIPPSEQGAQPETDAAQPETDAAQPETDAAQPETDAAQPEPQPVTQPAEEEQTEIPTPQADTTATQTTVTHVVQEREWLSQIARCYGTAPADILAANDIPYPGWIMPGESWTIPNVGSVSTSVGPPCIMFYTVQQGDTLFSIARQYSIPLNMLVFANYGCAGYNAHYDWLGYPYYPPVAVPYGDAAQLPSYPIDYQSCTYTHYPMLYIGDLLVIPVTPENMSLRP